MVKYQSITTDGVHHDVANFLTEIFFINKYGIFPPYAWRKNGSLAIEWPKTLSIIRKIINQYNVSPQQISWYLLNFQPKSLSEKDFGKLVYRVRKSFGYLPIDKLYDIYNKHFCNNQPLIIQRDYQKKNKKKTLLELLESMEL